MIGRKSSLGRVLIRLVWLLLAGPAETVAADNGIAWNFINLPSVGIAGQPVRFVATATNSGARPWLGQHHLEVRDDSGRHLSTVGLGDTAPGGVMVAVIAIQLPTAQGSYTYHFSALEHGAGYFGSSLARSIRVRQPPLAVSLSSDRSALIVGETTTIRSAAGVRGEVGRHGLEGRILGGPWQRWQEWSNGAGGVQTTAVNPAGAGVYELRAYAARDDDAEVAYSNRVLLEVSAVAPVITASPGPVIANVGETVTLSVSVSGTEPAFQWRWNDHDVPGATSATFTFSAAKVTQSGRYTVAIGNSAGWVVSRSADVIIRPLALPDLALEVAHFPGSGPRRVVSTSLAQVGDALSVRASSNLTAGTGWQHNILVRRPGITTATALPPEDGSGFTSAHEAWNKDGWGSPHTDGNSFDTKVTGAPALDLGNREPFIHALASGQTQSVRTLDFVLDAPGEWLVRAEVVDAAGELVAQSATVVVAVGQPLLATEIASITYPYGRADRFVGVFWNAGQAHRLWSTWRADNQAAYGATWAVNWKLMWQPSPYFRRNDGGWLSPSPPTDSPWQPFWAGHQVYAIVPDAVGRGKLTHDLTSQAFAEKAALRLMDVGVDFVAVDYTNQFIEEREDVLPAMHNLARAFQSLAPQSQSGERIKLTAVVPANISSGDWAGNGGFTPSAIARFNAKLTTLFNRYARFESAWFHLEDDGGVRKPLLLLWIGAGGESEPDGTLSPARLNQLRLTDGRAMADVFTIRWVGAYLADNPRYLTGGTYRLNMAGTPITGRLANAKLWSYHEYFPSSATVASGGTGASAAIEAVTVQPLAADKDRFGRTWDRNWPAGQGYHYETPGSGQAVPLASYGKIWRDALAAARALNPKFLLTTWAEFGSENDEPRPELSVTIMDNNKFGTHFGDALKDTVRRFKYRAPTAWIDSSTVAGASQTFVDVARNALPAIRLNQIVRLDGWVNPNVSTTFEGGSVKVYIDEILRGTATVGGAWNGGTHWRYDLSTANLTLGRHTVKVLADDGVGGTALAGVRFRDEAPRNTLSIEIVP